jgi:hypothetical protein
VVRPQSCRVIYYFDTPTLGRRHQLFDHVIELLGLSLGLLARLWKGLRTQILLLPPYDWFISGSYIAILVVSWCHFLWLCVLLSMLGSIVVICIYLRNGLGSHALVPAVLDCALLLWYVFHVLMATILFKGVCSLCLYMSIYSD